MRTTRHDISHLTERYALVALAIFALLLALATLARAVDEDDIVYYQMGAGGQLTERTVAPADYGTLGLDVDGHLVVRHDVLDASGNSKIAPAPPATWAWVNGATGNNGTAAWGNPSKPYLTLDAALEARPSSTCTVFIRGSVGNVSLIVNSTSLYLTIVADGGAESRCMVGSIQLIAGGGYTPAYSISLVGGVSTGLISCDVNEPGDGATIDVSGGTIGGVSADGNGDDTTAGSGGSITLTRCVLTSGCSASADDSGSSGNTGNGGTITMHNCTTTSVVSLSAEPVNSGGGGGIVIYGTLAFSPSVSATVSGFGKYYNSSNWIEVNN